MLRKVMFSQAACIAGAAPTPSQCSAHSNSSSSSNGLLASTPVRLQSPGAGAGGSGAFGTEVWHRYQDRVNLKEMANQTPAIRMQKSTDKFTVEKETEEDIQEMSGVSEEFGGGQRRVLRSFIGIDLGTTNSCLTFHSAETNKPKVIPSTTGSWVHPTCVLIEPGSGKRYFGENARAMSRDNPGMIMASGKRLIGRRYGELEKVRGQLRKTLDLAMSEEGEMCIEIAGKTYTVTHLMGMFLRHLRQVAEEYLQMRVDACVVSVPAYFTPQQKVATEDATLIAGFDVLEVIDEPTAACLSYSVLHPPTEEEKADPDKIVRLMVFDLGGGTLDIAIMDHSPAKGTYTLVGTHGDPLLGGNDWDAVIQAEILERFKYKWKIDVEHSKMRVHHDYVRWQTSSKIEAEKAKIHFTHSQEDYHGFEAAFYTGNGGFIVPLELDLTYEQYKEMMVPLHKRCVDALDTLFKKLGVTPMSVDRCLLVGAMTRDPPLRETLEKFIGIKPVSCDECPPDYAVAIGACVRGGMLQGYYPELMSSTKFVTGTAQAKNTGGPLQRAWEGIKSRVLIQRGENPNAVGTRWRGTAKGLSKHALETYAKDVVECEAKFSRMEKLDRAEESGDEVLQRVEKWSDNRAGGKEQRIIELTTQVKFWQYMVRTYHDHEEKLFEVMRTLNNLLDNLEGIDVIKDPSTFAKSGPKGGAGEYKVPNTSAGGSIHKPYNKPHEIDEKMAAAKEAEDGEKKHIREDGTLDLEALRLDKENKKRTLLHAEEAEYRKSRKERKLLRRELPVANPGSDEMKTLADQGVVGMVKDEIEVSETGRRLMLQDKIDMNFADPPAPPGESGSWREVQEALKRGEVLGELLSQQVDEGEQAVESIEGELSLEKQIAYLTEGYPLQPGEESAESRARKMKAVQAMSFIVVGPGAATNEVQPVAMGPISTQDLGMQEFSGPGAAESVESRHRKV